MPLPLGSPQRKKPPFKATSHGLTTERDDVAAVFMDKLPCDGLLHDLLHLEGKAAEGETPPPKHLGDVLITSFFPLPPHRIFCRPKACGLVTAPHSHFIELVFSAPYMSGLFSGVKQSVSHLLPW